MLLLPSSLCSSITPQRITKENHYYANHSSTKGYYISGTKGDFFKKHSTFSVWGLPLKFMALLASIIMQLGTMLLLYSEGKKITIKILKRVQFKLLYSIMLQHQFLMILVTSSLAQRSK